MKKILKKQVILILLGVMLTGCSRTSQAESYHVHTIEKTADVSWLLNQEEVIRETEDLQTKYDYDTKVTDKNGNILSELHDGKWHVSEEGSQFYGLISEITNNGIVAPNVRYAINLDTELTEDCLSILEENQLDGCIIVSDMKGNLQAVADYTNDIEYYADGEFKLSSAHEQFEELLEKDIQNQNYILHHTSGAPDEIIPIQDMYVGHTGRTYHSDGVYYGSTAKLMSSIVLLDAGMSFEDTSYYDEGVINYGYNKNVFNHNYPNSMYPKRQNMRTSLVNSYNTFFAAGYASIFSGSFYEDYDISPDDAVETLDTENGFSTISKIMNKYFGFNEFGSPKQGYTYPCDWMDLRQPSLNAIDTARENQKEEEFLIARMAIGMCSDGQIIDDKPTGNYFDASPLFLNAVTSAIATGDMYRLNIKSDSLTAKLKEMEYNHSENAEISEENLNPAGSEIKSIPLAYREALWDGMKSIMPYEYEGYTAYVKTGTADDGSSFRRFLITGFITEDEQPNSKALPKGWAITLYIHNGTKLDSEFASGYTNVYKQVLRRVIEGGQQDD